MRFLLGFAGVAMVITGASLGGAVADKESGSSVKNHNRRVLIAQRGPSLRESAGNRMSNPDYKDILGRPNNGPAVGEMAPDFNLMPLKFYEFGIETEDITVDNAGELYAPVRLSDFRGKKPVALIFGSYT